MARVGIRIRAAFAIIILSLLLTGCAEAQFGSTFEKDGSAVHQLELTFPTQALDSPEAQELLASIQAESEVSNIDFERVDDVAGRTTIQLTSPSGEGEDVGAALNNLVNTTGIASEQEIRTPFTGTYRREIGAFGGTEFVLDLTVDGPELAATITEIVESTSDTVASAPGEIVTIRYVAIMPGEIDNETNGDKIADDTVRWDIPFDRPLNMRAESQVRSAGSTTLFLVLAGLLAVVVAGLAAGIGIILMRRRRLAERLVNTTGVVTLESPFARDGILITRQIERLLLWLRRRTGADEPLVPLFSDLPIEEDEDGADTEGDGSPAGVHGGGAGPKTAGAGSETQSPRSDGHPH
jgi:hypothetical protein